MNSTPSEQEPEREWRRSSSGWLTKNSADSDSSPDQLYSPFWALALVFLALIFLQTIYLRGDFTKWDQIHAAREQLNTVLNKAQTINQMTEAVGRDLLTLATNSPEAAKIIAEFKIQLNTPVNPAK